MEVSLQQQQFKKLLLNSYEKAHELNVLTTGEFIRDIKIELKELLKIQIYEMKD